MTDGRNPDLDEHLYEKRLKQRFSDIGLPVEETPLGKPNYRIEALRAASRVVAGVAKEFTVENAELDTLTLADRFARWLEDRGR